MKTDSRALTGIRGVAALFVVIYHFSNAKLFLFWNGYLAVDLFFILSGFIMSMVYARNFAEEVSLNGFMRFLYHRFARIYPLYASILAFMIWYYTSNGSILEPKTISNNLLLVQGLFGGSLVGASWSVSVELVAYITFPFICLAVHKHRSLSLFIVIVSFLGLYSLPGMNTYHSSGLLDIYTGGLAVFRGVFGFLIGIGVFNLLPAINERLLSSGFFGDAILSLIVILLFYKGYDLIFVILCTIYIALLYKGNSISKYILSTRPMYFLGEISFSVYMVHLIFQRQYGGVFVELSQTYIGNYDYAPMALMLLSTVMVATVTYLIIERPARRMLRALEPALFK